MAVVSVAVGKIEGDAVLAEVVGALVAAVVPAAVGDANLGMSIEAMLHTDLDSAVEV